MNNKYYILMGDIVKSGEYDGIQLSKDFQALIDECNNIKALDILSPYTITLGDEFQGIARDLRSGIESIFLLEDTILKWKLKFRLRYVLYYGTIDTPLNNEIAYGMLGEGLSKARKVLAIKSKKNRPKYHLNLANEVLTRSYNNLFYVLEGLAHLWSPKDYALILDMLQNDNNSEVSKKYDKTRSQIWKRRITLKIKEYNAIKSVIFDLISIN